MSISTSDMEIISLRKNPEYLEHSIACFQEKWATEYSMDVYGDSMRHCIDAANPLPQIRKNNRNKLLVRHTKTTDLDSVMSIFDNARTRMRASGNLTQWVDGYPTKNLILDDIRNGNSYVVEIEQRIIGVFTFIEGDEPTYSKIEGRWLDNKPYGTIHRIAAAPGVNGIADACLEFCLLKDIGIRVDTHVDNKPMLGWLSKRGFSYCGNLCKRWHSTNGFPVTFFR